MAKVDDLHSYLKMQFYIAGSPFEDSTTDFKERLTWKATGSTDFEGITSSL